MRDRFGHRHRALKSREELSELGAKLASCLGQGDATSLRAVVEEYHPADIADAMRNLSDAEDVTLFQMLTDEEAAEVLDELNETTLRNLVQTASHDRLARILTYLPADEAVDILGLLPVTDWELVLGYIDQPYALRTLLTYDPKTAGGIMTLDFTVVSHDRTCADALAEFKQKRSVEPIFYVFVTDLDGRFMGAVDFHALLRAELHRKIGTLVDTEVVRVPPDMDQETVALIFARYDLTAVPVVCPDWRLHGIITADDIIDVVLEEADEDIARLAGTDAHELEKKSPSQIALMRLPWIMITLFIELIAGFVIKAFDGTLSQILLLASFMPIISAISGNTGLQSAAIIIRGLSSGDVNLSDWKHAVRRQLATTVILGGACGLVLGTVGAIWYGKWTFGALVATGMFASVNIAGAVGTAIPLVSKHFGFDPAMTAGPFETAFQDVVGISIFLGMATLLMPFLK